MVLALQKGVIYGPVHSRRLGLSLGINVLPPGKKACPFDCLYCQYGWTEVHTIKIERRDLGLPSVEMVIKSLQEAIQRFAALGIRPAYLTFSGNGEPTLHPEFIKIVKGVKAIRDEWIPEAKTAILSNSAMISRPLMQKALLELDFRIMKLDCGRPSVFQKYNRPCGGISLDRITRGLEEIAQAAPIIIQALVSSGKSGNFDARNIREWIERLKRIRPSMVQIYTLDRQSPAQDIRPATLGQLFKVMDACKEEGVSAEVFR